MHNLKEIRKNTELFEKKIKERNSTIDLKSLIKHDKENRELIQKKEKLEQEKKIQQKRNVVFNVVSVKRYINHHH